MPLYEYHCRQCDTDNELLVRGHEHPTCPHCGSRQLEKLLSVPAAPAVNGSQLPVASEGTCGRPECGMGGCQGLARE